MAVREIAVLTVDAARAEAFEATFPEAIELLIAAPGCRSAVVTATLDSPAVYVLEVVWERRDDHVVAFAASPASSRLAAGFGSHFVEAPVVVHVAA